MQRGRSWRPSDSGARRSGPSNGQRHSLPRRPSAHRSPATRSRSFTAHATASGAAARSPRVGAAAFRPSHGRRSGLPNLRAGTKGGAPGGDAGDGGESDPDLAELKAAWSAGFHPPGAAGSSVWPHATARRGRKGSFRQPRGHVRRPSAAAPPPTLPRCPRCHRQFGNASIGIHLTRCRGEPRDAGLSAFTHKPADFVFTSDDDDGDEEDDDEYGMYASDDDLPRHPGDSDGDLSDSYDGFEADLPQWAGHPFPPESHGRRPRGTGAGTRFPAPRRSGTWSQRRPKGATEQRPTPPPKPSATRGPPGGAGDGTTPPQPGMPSWQGFAAWRRARDKQGSAGGTRYNFAGSGYRRYSSWSAGSSAHGAHTSHTGTPDPQTGAPRGSMPRQSAKQSSGAGGADQKRQSVPKPAAPRVPAKPTHVTGQERNKRWEAFAASPPAVVTVASVPWLPLDRTLTLSDLGVPPGASKAEKKKAVKQATLRWHPDKFQQRFGGLLQPGDRDAVLGKVKATIQQLNALRAHLSSS